MLLIQESFMGSPCSLILTHRRKKVWIRYIAKSDITLLTIEKMFTEFSSIIGKSMKLALRILQPNGYGICQMEQVCITDPLQGTLWKKANRINYWCIRNIHPFPNYCDWNRWYRLSRTIHVPVWPMTIFIYSWNIDPTNKLIMTVLELEISYLVVDLVAHPGISHAQL